ncbi:cytoplasmic protein [Pedobacter yulinensis]|uniref:Cytoplasmic protein n=1 Tax=Pedobacter yulinensis TaxID=2126353 RepID=A0A2T3HN96_9SPHI|nr:crosslink repair DNA glycosylase YcaQ family protein [Pedobacter yulinensis]PST83914.1 cytoplasmic protein [Pedobacter yulinensis]
MKAELSAAEARRIGLTAQGFNALSRSGPVTVAALRKTIGQLGLLQIDSVNVLARAHYMPLFSRLGVYDRAMLDALTIARPRRFFEYWGHEASILPVELQPLLRWRMENAYQGKGVWGQLAVYAGAKKEKAAAVLSRIRTGGPVAASDLAGPKAGKGMWAWSESKHILEWLFWAGQIAATHRRNNFERVYDLPERVLPKAILGQVTPHETDAKRQLLSRAAKALGIATADDLRDYYRIPAADARLPIEQLVEEGTLSPVHVQGWPQQAYLYKDARAGRSLQGATLLSPFDPLIWHRPRTERLFGFHYRLEIYTPAHKREYGYYVLPFLLDGVLVARADLKAERNSNTLLVLRLHFEPKAPPHAMESLLNELKLMALWLGLARVTIVSHGVGHQAYTGWTGTYEVL